MGEGGDWWSSNTSTGTRVSIAQGDDGMRHEILAYTVATVSVMKELLEHVLIHDLQHH